MPIPAIYGDLSDEAKAAYAAWVGALFEQTDHVMACSGACGRFSECPAYAQLHEKEQRAWQDWHEARRLERGNVS